MRAEAEAPQLGAAFEYGGHIQLLEFDAAVAEPNAGNRLQSLGLAGGFAAAVGFEQADHHIGAVPEPFDADPSPPGVIGHGAWP